MSVMWAALLLVSIIGGAEGSKCGAWSAWSSCSATCGGGTWTRTRVCPAYVIGETTETSSCNYHTCPRPPKCPVPPVLRCGAWSAWSACSVSCGGGSRTRTRVCHPSTPVGEDTETGHCNYHTCPPTVCDDDEVTQEPTWKLSTVNISTTSADIMIGTVDIKGQKLGLCWQFANTSVTVVAPPCNRLRAGTMVGAIPGAQLLGPECTYEVPEAQHEDISVQDDGGTCAITLYDEAPDCPNNEVVTVAFCSQKVDVGVLLNVEPEADEISFLVGLLGDNETLALLNMQRYNACMRALPGTPWKAVLYKDNDVRVLINGQCTYITTNEPDQKVNVGPVCGGWGDWGPWEECTFTAMMWRQRRRRPCDSPPPQNDGHCEGDQYEYRTCVCAAPTIPHLARSGVLQVGYNRGDTVEVCCKEGYVSAVTGRSSFTICCDFYNRWENFEPCIRLECPHPVFPHGIVKPTTPPYYRGKEVTVVCNHGYTNIYGKRTFISRCTGTTWWPSRCVVKYCDLLPSIPYVLPITPGVTSYRPGDTVGVRCHVGYTLSPNASLTCDDYGHWSPNLRCIATTCPSTIDMFQYNIGSLRLGRPGTPRYNVAFLTCNFGYTARGKTSYTSKCLPDGTWSDLQQCQHSGGGLALDGASIGLIVALFAVLALIALCCGLLCCRNLCCALRQPVLLAPAHPAPPVYAEPIYHAPRPTIYQAPRCPPPEPPCAPRQPSRMLKLMYRLRRVPVARVVPTTEMTC